MDYKAHVWYFVTADLPFVGAAGRIYINKDTGELAVGDGVTTWSSLPKVAGGVSAHSGLSGLTSGDDHTQYRLEAADHDHTTTGIQGGTLTPAALPNRTRGLYLPAGASLFNDTGTAAVLSDASPDARVNVIRLDDGVTDRVYGTFLVPADWASGALTLRVHFSMASTSGTPAVRLRAQHSLLSSAAWDVAYTVVAFANITITSTTNEQTQDFTLGTPSAGGELWQVAVERQGANAGDTYNQNMRIFGFEIRYTADS